MSVGSKFDGLKNLSYEQLQVIISMLFNRSDIGYNNELSPIPTPYIDSLARSPNAVQFSQYYVHSLCSPTRASLLTGRYSVNAGMPFVIVPGY